MQLIQKSFVPVQSLLEIFKAGKINDSSCALPASREEVFKQRATSASVSHRTRTGWLFTSSRSSFKCGNYARFVREKPRGLLMDLWIFKSPGWRGACWMRDLLGAEWRSEFLERPQKAAFTRDECSAIINHNFWLFQQVSAGTKHFKCCRRWVGGSLS